MTSSGTKPYRHLPAYLALAAVALLTGPAAIADMLTLEWASQFVGTDASEAGSSAVTNTATAFTKAGSMYITGGFTGTIDFDLGPTVHNLTAVGANDIFVAAMDGEGAYLWATQLKPGAGGSIDASTLSIATDPEGNVAITGIFHGTIDFDTSTARRPLTSLSASGDVFVLKLDDEGKFLWVRRISATEATVVDIAFDSLGDVYIGGNFLGAADVDPGVETFTLTSLQGTSHFIVRWDVEGAFVWANQLLATTPQSEALGQTLAVDSAGNVLTAGTFHWSVEFDTDPVDTEPAKAFQASSTSMFLAKLDPAGAVTWAKQFDQIDMDTGAYGLDIQFDGTDAIHLSGHFRGALDADPSVGTEMLSVPTGEQAAFITKLTSGGSFTWAAQTQAFGADLAAINAVTVDLAGNVYSTGPFEGTVDVDPGLDEFELESLGASDIFVQSIRSNGAFDSASQFGDVGPDTAHHIGVDAAAAVYVLGEFSGTVDFDTSPGIYALSAPAGRTSTFVMKLSPIPCTTPPALTGVTATDGLEPDGVEITWDPVMTSNPEYQVLRSATNNIASATPLSPWIREIEFLDETAESPVNGPLNCSGLPIPTYTTYYYWVQWRPKGTPCISEPSLSDTGYRGGPPAEVEPAGADLALIALLLSLLLGLRLNPRNIS